MFDICDRVVVEESLSRVIAEKINNSVIKLVIITLCFW